MCLGCTLRDTVRAPYIKQEKVAESSSFCRAAQFLSLVLTSFFVLFNLSICPNPLSSYPPLCLSLHLARACAPVCTCQMRLGLEPAIRRIEFGQPLYHARRVHGWEHPPAQRSSLRKVPAMHGGGRFKLVAAVFKLRQLCRTMNHCLSAAQGELICKTECA